MRERQASRSRETLVREGGKAWVGHAQKLHHLPVQSSPGTGGVERQGRGEEEEPG